MKKESSRRICEESQQKAKVDQNPPRPAESPEEQQEGRKLYVTKCGEKYHFEKTCNGLNGYQSFKKKARRMCRQRTEEILTLSACSGSVQSQTTLGFQMSKDEYHAEECLVYRNDKRSKDERMICMICDRTIIWARNRESARKGRMA